jgi:chromosome segregation ATPase
MEQQESEMQEQMWELQEAVARGERDISLLKLTISHKDEEIVRLQATAQGADGSTVDSLARQKDELEAVISELEASLKEVSAGAAREREEGRRRELAFEEERSEIVAYVEELKALVAEQKAHAAEQLSVIQELEDARDNASQQVSNLAEELTKETSRRGSLEMTLAHHQAVIEELRATGPPQLTAAPEQSSQSILALPAPPAGDVAPATHPLTVVVSVDVQPRREAPVSPAPWPMPPTVPPEGLVIKGVAQEVIPSVHRKVKEQVFALENAPLAPDSGGEEQMHDDWLMVPTGLPTASHEVGNRNDSDDAEARRETWSVLPGSGLVGSEVPLSGETTSAPLSLAPDSGGGSSVSDAAPLSLRSASTARNRFGSFKGNVSNESLPARTIEEPPQEDTSNEALPAAADEELPHESDFDGYLAKDGKVDSRSRHEVSVHEHELEEQLAAQVAELDHLHVIEETDRLGILQLQQYAARLQQVIEEQAAAAKGGQQAQQAREVEFMREETSAYRKQMQQLSDEIVELQRIRDSERQHAKEQLRDMASGFQKAVDEVQAQTEDARKQIEEWRARTLEAEEARQTAEQNSDTLEEEMNQMRVIEKDLNARLHQVQDELRQSGLERDRLQEQLRKLVEHNAVLQELADGLEKTPQMTNQAMEEELVMARSKIQVLNDELESGNTLLRRQEDELATLRVRVESTVEPARTCGDEQLESLLEKEIARADDLQREVMKLKVDIITYDEQYDNDWQEKLTYQKEALIKDMLDTRKDLKAALSDKEDLELQLRNAQQEKSELSVAVEHGIMKARADRDILEGTLAEAKDATQVDQVKQQNRQLSEQLRVCQGDLEDLKQRYIKVVSRNSEIEEKMREIALHEKRMSDDILSMQQERDEVTKEREKLEDVSSSREESIRQLEQAKRMLESELSGSINEMRTKVRSLARLCSRTHSVDVCTSTYPSESTQQLNARCQTGVGGKCTSRAS